MVTDRWGMRRTGARQIGTGQQGQGFPIKVTAAVLGLGLGFQGMGVAHDVVQARMTGHDVSTPAEPLPLAAGLSYSNCLAASTAGAAPIYRGEPGYSPHLDRDSDGVACE